MAEKTPAAVAPPSAVPSPAAPPAAVIVQSKSSLTTMVLAAALAIAGGGIVASLLEKHGGTDAAEGAAAEKPSVTIVHLDGFTVNLADPEENHFLRVTIDLAIERMPAPAEREKLNSGLPMARIRDTIVSALTVCKADVLLTPEGKLQLKKDLLEALNRENPELGIREIYFTEFLVQR